MLLKCCTQHVSIFEKLSSGHRTGQGQFLSQSQFCVKFRSCVQKVNYTHSIRSLFNNQCWKHTSLGSQGQRSWTALSLSTCMSTLNHFTKQNISHTMKTEHFSHLLKLSFSLIFASLQASSSVGPGKPRLPFEWRGKAGGCLESLQGQRDLI